MLRHFTNYGIPGITLPPEQFKSEGRYPTGGPQSKDVQVFVFKAFQCRIYGVTTTFQGVETFVGLEILTNKKTDRVSDAFLRGIARKSALYLA